MRLDINHITFMMLDDDLDDIHDKKKAVDTCGDDMTNDEILQNSIPDIHDFVLSDDDRSFATELPMLDIDTLTLTHFKPIDLPNDPTDVRVCTEIRPFPRSFINGIREHFSPSLTDQVTDIDLANVIFESFGPLLSQPGSYHDLCEQLVTFIRDQHQGVETPTKKKRKGKKKDPNRHKMKNRVVTKPYNKSEKQTLKESKKVVKNKARGRKTLKKRFDDDHVTKAVEEQRQGFDGDGPGFGGGDVAGML